MDTGSMQDDRLEVTQAAGSQNLQDALARTWRVLTFRANREEILLLNRQDLVLGLLFTWLAGVGRYWDNPKAEVLQAMGLGSILYVFALALFLWIILMPLRPANWNYFRILTYITLTAPPALLYAIPFQIIFPDPEHATANTLNAILLGIVAVWRVALLWRFLRVAGELSNSVVALGTLFPIILIITVITMLNLEHVVFHIMGGITNPTPNDLAYEILFIITSFSVMAAFPAFIFYAVEVFGRTKEKRSRSAVREEQAQGTAVGEVESTSAE